MENNSTFEKSKMEKYNVGSIVRKMNDHTIRFDHPVQRESEQWTPKMKGNLISDILQGNPIPALVLAEQVVNGMSIIWNLDGKQRCTNVYDYINDGFKITKTIRRNIIKYQSIIRDEEGNSVLDENGFPKMEWIEFDLCNKKYSQLPRELQERINEYCFEAVLYLNCSNDDIAYHITRYNEGKPMNQSQKGIIRLGEEYASIVKSISKMPFFTDCGCYSHKDSRNGTIDRVVTESVMAINYLDHWKKNQEDMCKFLKKNATIEQFDELEDTIERLTDIVMEEHDELFNTKESFIWFTVFTKFKKMKYEDNIFAEFLTAYVNELHSKKINDVTYDELKENRSTKDKSVIIKKITHLEQLLNDFLKER